MYVVVNRLLSTFNCDYMTMYEPESKNQQPEIVFTFKVTAYIIYFDFHFRFHLCHDEN